MKQMPRGALVFSLMVLLPSCRSAPVQPVQPNPGEASDVTAVRPVLSAEGYVVGPQVVTSAPAPLVYSLPAEQDMAPFPPEGPASSVPSQAARSWLPAGATSAELQAAAWAVLEGQTPASGLPVESFDPERPFRPSNEIVRAANERSLPFARLRFKAMKITPSSLLPAEGIQRVVRQNYGYFRLCYVQGLQSIPTLQGAVILRFVIAADGSIKGAKIEQESLADASVVGCVVRAFLGLSFPAPENGEVTVVYSVAFSPQER